MFGRKAKQEKEPNAPYSREIMEIHHEFECAGDKLLMKAQEILGKCAEQESDVYKAQRLIRAGFENAQQAVKGTEIKQREELSRKTAELISYYKMNYPNNKFITKEQVIEICKKYNLICAPTKNYKGFVPEKNLKQIEAFNIKSIDETNQLIKITGFTYFSLESDQISEFKRKFKDCIVEIDSSNFREGILGTTFRFGERFVTINKYEKMNNNQLMICAPKKDIDTKGLKRRGFAWFATTFHVVPDPVVLRPCKGGFLIVTAWGDEASDELVVNQNNN